MGAHVGILAVQSPDAARWESASHMEVASGAANQVVQDQRWARRNAAFATAAAVAANSRDVREVHGAQRTSVWRMVVGTAALNLAASARARKRADFVCDTAVAAGVKLNRARSLPLDRLGAVSRTVVASVVWCGTVAGLQSPGANRSVASTWQCTMHRSSSRLKRSFRRRLRRRRNFRRRRRRKCKLSRKRKPKLKPLHRRRRRTSLQRTRTSDDDDNEDHDANEVTDALAARARSIMWTTEYLLVVSRMNKKFHPSCIHTYWRIGLKSLNSEAN